MKKKTDSPRLALVVMIEETPTRFDSHNSAWITAYPAHIKHGSKDGFEYVSRYSENASLGNIQFRALLMSDASGRDATSPDAVSGELSHAKAYELEPILKRLKTIEARYRVLYDKFGAPANFAQGLCYYADAIGAGLIITERGLTSRERSGERFVINGTSQGAYEIQNNIKLWFDKFAPKETEVLS